MDAHVDEVLDRVVAWGRGRPDVVAMILTSSRARDDGRADELSDHDVIVAVDDPASFAASLDWQVELGTPVTRWGDEAEVDGYTTVFRGVIYDDGAKLDLTFWPRELLSHVATNGSFMPELDMGYRVLFDDDGATARWPAPTFRAFVPARPSADDYRALVELFWWDVSYAAKALHRGEVVFAKSFMFEHEMRLEVLTEVLGWLIEVRNDWSLPLGTYGRQLDHHLPPDLREAFLRTYVGPSTEENWDALDGLCALFRQAATEVGAALGYPYPAHVDRWMTAHMTALRERTR